MRSLHILTIAALLWPAGGQILRAEPPRDAALGVTGEVYLSHVGTLAELFPEAPPPGNPHSPALAVEILEPGQPAQRHLVPETGGPEAEGQPSLVYEDASASLFVVWESKAAPVLSRINLAWLKDGEWSPVVEVSGDISPLKGPPKVVLTRDSFQADSPEPTTRERTVIHVTWWEQAATAAQEDVYYTPIVVEDGAYVGSNAVVNLTDLDPDSEPADPAGLPSELSQAPSVEIGRDARSVVVGFASPRTERFLSFEMQVVAGDISSLGLQVADAVLDEAELYTPVDLPELANSTGAHLIDIGHRLHPALAAYLAQEVEAFILDFGAGDPGGAATLADQVRSHIVDIGARISGDGGLSAGGVPAVVDEILSMSPGTGAAGDHALRLRLVASWPAPATRPGETWVFLSEDGSNALVSWEEEGDRLYRETDDAGWTEVHRLVLEGPLDVDRAEQILRFRVRER